MLPSPIWPNGTGPRAGNELAITAALGFVEKRGHIRDRNETSCLIEPPRASALQPIVPAESPERRGGVVVGEDRIDDHPFCGGERAGIQFVAQAVRFAAKTTQAAHTTDGVQSG